MFKRIIQATKQSLDERNEQFVFLFVFILSNLLYYFAIVSVVSIGYFLTHNPSWVIISQIILILLNSFLTAIAFVMFIKIFKNKKAENKTSIIGTIIAMILSVFSTGCYVCGTVLFPAIGLGSSFASLPFGGIEIKFITLGLLLYSVSLLSNNVLGICKVFSNKKFSLKLSGLKLFSFSDKTIYQLRHFLIIFTFVGAIFILPLVIPESIKRDENSFICDYIQK